MQYLKAWQGVHDVTFSSESGWVTWTVLREIRKRMLKSGKLDILYFSIGSGWAVWKRMEWSEAVCRNGSEEGWETDGSQVPVWEEKVSVSVVTKVSTYTSRTWTTPLTMAVLERSLVHMVPSLVPRSWWMTRTIPKVCIVYGQVFLTSLT